MKNFVLFLIILGWSQVEAQVGINTNVPNPATILDIVSDSKGILIPRLTDAQRDASLADNDTITHPPAGVVNSSLTPGTLIFNTTDNRFQFWDGVVWRQLFVATSSEAGNDGVVRIDGGKNGAQPIITNFGNNNTFGNPKQIKYDAEGSGLTYAPSPTTSWPETIPNPVDSVIYLKETGKFRENPIKGQVHLWRLIVKITAGASSSGAVMATMINPDSLFEVNSIQVMPSGSSNGNLITFYFYTIADNSSLGDGKGYQIWLDSNKQNVAAQVISLTRVSLFKD